MIPGVWSTSGPALRAYYGKLFAAWKGMDGDQGLWYSSFDGASWAPQRQISNVASSVGPALETHGGALWAVWKGWFGDQSMWSQHVRRDHLGTAATDREHRGFESRPVARGARRRGRGESRDRAAASCRHLRRSHRKEILAARIRTPPGASVLV